MTSRNLNISLDGERHGRGAQGRTVKAGSETA